MLDMTEAEALIRKLDLQPHPEGGWYRQTWVADSSGRPSGTCIYFLLRAEERSHWHRVNAAEIWHYYAGAPLVLSQSHDTIGPAVDMVLGPDVLNGQQPQIVIPPHHWQAARSTGDWTLVGCTVSPGFEFSGFELAHDGFDIPRAEPAYDYNA